MLRVLGSPKRLCDGLSRRDFLWAGGLGMAGLGLADLLRLQQAPAASATPVGRAKAVILLFLYGSPSQLETVDMKPDAPEEIRGTFKPIRSTLPGCDVCELMPHLARVMHKTTVLRSLTHPHPIHGVAFATTGVPTIDVAMELSPRDARHAPFIGSAVSYILEQQGRSRQRPVPDNIALPFPFSTRRTGEVHRAGPYAAYLGSAYHPHWTEFQGKATRTMTKTLAGQTLDVQEPYMGITPDSRFTLGSNTQLPADLTIDRFNARKSLLEQLDDARRDFDATPGGRSHDRYREMAYSVLGSARMREALDLQKEPLALRERYGMTLFGQGCLAARRLVEAGSRFVTVFWDEYGLAGSGWDTHWDHFNRMKQELMPGWDQGMAGLIQDLDDRGMLDETLVVCLSEHGRTPQLNKAKGGGRDHWSQAYSAILAGGGVARGRVVGKTDRIAGTVVDRPISPKDVLATIYHLLGIDLHTTLIDRTNRPQPLLPVGEPIREALA